MLYLVCIVAEKVDALINVLAFISEEIIWRKHHIHIPDLVDEKYFLRISHFHSLLTSTLKVEVTIFFETSVTQGTVM